jgi:hypothetical protein
MTWGEYFAGQAKRIGLDIDGAKLYKWCVWRCPDVLDASEVLSGRDIPESILYRAAVEIRNNNGT